MLGFNFCSAASFLGTALVALVLAEKCTGPAVTPHRPIAVCGGCVEASSEKNDCTGEKLKF